MKRTLEGMAKVGEPLLNEVLKVIRVNRSSQDGGVPPEVLGHLEIAGELLYHAVVNFQLLEAGGLSESIH